MLLDEPTWGSFVAVPVMASETVSSPADETPAAVAGPDKRGKHRILAEVKRLEQDTQYLEEELEVLEKTENVSTICKELLHNMESRSDPLLPEIRGPVNLLWDRWFEGPQDAQSCRCWIL